MVQDYMVLFKQYAGRTKLSDNNKLIRYRKHLSTFIKDRLTKTDWVHDTFNIIVIIVMDIDKYHQECLAEKAREADHFISTTSSRGSSNGYQGSLQLFQNSADPNTINISARAIGNRKMRKDWKKALHGKCYGYSSQEYSITKCVHKHAICQ